MNTMQPRLATRNRATSSVTDKDARIKVFLHYSEANTDERTVFGRARDKLFYNYSDRLYQFDHDKWREGQELAKSQGLSHETARYYEVALSHFHDAKCNLEHIILGCNRSNGFHYLVFGYTY